MELRPEQVDHLFRMPLPLLVQFASNADHFVGVVVERWAKGQYVPESCHPGWLGELTERAEIVSHVATIRRVGLPLSPGGSDPPGMAGETRPPT